MSLQSKSSHPPQGAETSDCSPDDILARLSTYLADDLEQVDRLIHRALLSQITLTNEVGRYLQAASGKRLRPMLTLLASRVGNERVEAAVNAAVLVELLHLASLLHDDVIDRASLRRGRPTVNTRWGPDVAILMADYLYSRAFSIAFEKVSPPLVVEICRVTTAMCDGEMLQIEKRDQLLTEQDYLYVIRCKTAELFSACARLGSTLAGASEATISALERYGLEFGCAFQITDDVLDLTADPDRLGKEIGTDIACGKQTLPLIRALEKADAEDRAFLIAALNDSRSPSLVVERVVKYGGIEYAMDVAQQYAKRARACLRELPEGPSLNFLRGLTELVVNRAY